MQHYGLAPLGSSRLVHFSSQGKGGLQQNWGLFRLTERVPVHRGEISRFGLTHTLFGWGSLKFFFPRVKGKGRVPLTRDFFFQKNFPGKNREKGPFTNFILPLLERGFKGAFSGVPQFKGDREGYFNFSGVLRQIGFTLGF